MIRRSHTRFQAAGAVVTLLSAWMIGGCSSSDRKVDVALGEFTVEPDRTAVEAGRVKFAVENRGALTHEFVVVRAPDAESLPTDDDGAVAEDELGADALLGEIEDISSQSAQSKELDLDPGSYVLFCNLTEESSESHFQKGMHAELQVR